MKTVVFLEFYSPVVQAVLIPARNGPKQTKEESVVRTSAGTPEPRLANRLWSPGLSLKANDLRMNFAATVEPFHGCVLFHCSGEFREVLLGKAPRADDKNVLTLVRRLFTGNFRREISAFRRGRRKKSAPIEEHRCEKLVTFPRALGPFRVLKKRPISKRGCGPSIHPGANAIRLSTKWVHCSATLRVINCRTTGIFARAAS